MDSEIRNPHGAPAQPSPADRLDARELRLHLYREVGISAVAAALLVMRDPAPPAMPALRRVEEHAA